MRMHNERQTDTRTHTVSARTKVGGYDCRLSHSEQNRGCVHSFVIRLQDFVKQDKTTRLPNRRVRPKAIRSTQTVIYIQKIPLQMI